MGTIDRILQLQQDYRTLATEWRRVKQTYDSLISRYGGSRDQWLSRLEQIRRELDDPLHPLKTGSHGSFDSRHNALPNGSGGTTWTWVEGCSACNHLKDVNGITPLEEERAQIYEWGKELNGYLARLRELRLGCRPNGSGSQGQSSCLKAYI
jgi:hypothetical protein